MLFCEKMMQFLVPSLRFAFAQDMDLAKLKTERFLEYSLVRDALLLLEFEEVDKVGMVFQQLLTFFKDKLLH